MDVAGYFVYGVVLYQTGFMRNRDVKTNPGSVVGFCFPITSRLSYP